MEKKVKVYISENKNNLNGKERKEKSHWRKGTQTGGRERTGNGKERERVYREREPQANGEGRNVENYEGF